MNELKEIDSSVEISTVNFGRGADWILLLATLSSITSIISLGDKLEKGIDGWIKIGKRISKIFHNSDKVYIDEDLAKIMAISHISKNYDIKSIKLIDNHTTFLVDFSKWFKRENKQDLTSKPFNIYNFTFELNNERTISLSIKSNGEIIEILDIEIETLNNIL